MTAADHTGTDFRERLYKSYVSGHIHASDWTQAVPALRHDIVSRLPPHRQARILDVGCGQGNLIELLHREGYRNVYGVDTSAEQVDYAHRRGLRNVEEADLFDYLARASAPFDAIVAVDLLEHFDQPNVLRVLDAMYQGLAPSGRLVLRTPNSEGPFGGRYRYWDFTHGTAFTPASVRQVCAAAGFRTIDVFPQEPVPHGLKSAARFALWRVISGLVKGYLAIETGVVRGHIVSQNLIAVAHKTD